MSELKKKILAVIKRLEEENQFVAASLAYNKPISFYENNTIEEAVRILIEERK
jgi:hypothetical protein